ncbi:tail fiber domain-containing protein [Aquirufa sp. KTFRIE-69F]|uniref:Tail fiber domain-containing protein n=1 Tax=Aquirufa originis TaxID=3096514 RepID=A0ABW6D585_9BACT
MKKTLFFLLISLNVFAQTGIGTTTPDASAKLEVASSNKGFLPPRVALTATNSASPITSPANGLMVFNTATTGASPFNVLPGYYYWDGVGLKWVSLSTTVGNVQNQGIFRSTANTAVNSIVSSWNSRFNNIAAGDLTITSNTTFALANGIYKIEWALPYQSSNTYNIIQLQENMSGTWNALLNDAGYSTLGNGGNTDWGGGTFAADIVDCSSSTRTFRFFNLDIYRQLYYGATFIITKLNPSITTSTTADNLGNHTATKNIQLGGNYLSNDGGNEGISVDNLGKVGIGNNAPTQTLDVTGTGKFSTSLINAGARTYLGKDGSNMHWFATTDAVVESNNLAYGFESNGSSIQSHKWYTGGTSKMQLLSNGKLGLGTASPATTLHIENANTFGTDPSNTTSPSLYILNTNNTSSSAHASALIRTAGLTGGKPYLGFDIVGQFGYSMGINNSSDQFIINTDWNFNTSTASSNALIINNAGQSRVIIPYSGGSYQNDWPSGWGGGLATYDISASAIYYNSLVQRSDRRLKNTIADINNDVKTNYLKLRPVTYYWNQDKPRDTSLQYGLIAQEVETLFPEIVLTATDSGQTKSINYQALHALSLKVIQTQQTEIEELKQKQLDLEGRLKLLESKIK